MSHNVETMAYRNETPWHGLGVKVDHAMSAADMVQAAGLNWTVSKRPLVTADGVPVKSAFGLLRDSDDKVLSVVGSGYKPVQNDKIVEFFKRFTDAGSMKMETAGSLNGGRYVWALARIERDFNVAGVGKDPIKGYLLMSSPHVHGKALMLQTTAIRVVCWNTLSWSIREGAKMDGKVGGQFRMPHSVEFNEGVQEVAIEAMGLAQHQLQVMEEQAAVLAKTRIDDKTRQTFFLNVLRTKQDADKALPRLAAQFEDAYHSAPGQNLKTAEGTWWGALNAITYVADHVMAKTQDIRLRNTWFGHVAAMKRRALDLALDGAQK